MIKLATRLALVLFVLAAALTPLQQALPAAAQAQCALQEQRQVFFEAVDGSLFLQDITSTGVENVWGAGYYNTQNGPFRTAITLWNGTSPISTPGANVEPSGVAPENRLASIAALAPDNIWAAGHYIAPVGSSGTVAEAPLVLRWNGSNWSVAPGPTPDRPAVLLGIAPVSNNDVWAAGYTRTSNGNAPYLVHWDGRSWREIEQTWPQGGSAQLVDIVSTAGNNVWAAGTYRGASDQGAFLAHWDGQNRSNTILPVQPDPTPGLVTELNIREIAATGPNDVWMVGSRQVTRPSNTPRVPPATVSLESIIYHWDGSAWNMNPLPEAAKIGALQSVAAYSRTDAWAGGYKVQNGSNVPLLLHWNGSAWTETGSPGVIPIALTAPATQTAWALGGDDNSFRKLYLNCPTAANPASPIANPNDPNATYFPEVGHTLRGVFRDYWNANGGLQQFGYPLTEEFQEVSPTDGKTYTVQYFERNRFEYHPENAAPYNVLLGLLGRFITRVRKAEQPFLPAQQSGSGRYFPQTSHNLANEFISYWDSRGGLAVYGYPISEAFIERSPTDGKDYLVQYFERNRLELHPELQEPYRISLGLLGSQILKERGWIR